MVDFDSQRKNNNGGATSATRAPRDSIFLLANIFTADGHAAGKARVRNLSATGLQADLEKPVFADGDKLDIELRNIGVVSGQVAWVRGNKIGMVFDQKIDPQAVRKPVGASADPALPPYLRVVPYKGLLRR